MTQKPAYPFFDEAGLKQIFDSLDETVSTKFPLSQAQQDVDLARIRLRNERCKREGTSQQPLDPPTKGYYMSIG